MSLHVYSIDEKLAAVERQIVRAKRFQSAHDTDLLKAVAADLRARQDLPRNNAFGSIERAIKNVKATIGTEPHGFEQDAMFKLARTIIQHWPVIAQALERYGEISAE